jgi:uncharacterized protein YegL
MFSSKGGRRKMGTGFLNEATGKIDLILSVQHDASTGVLDAWEAAFEQASRLLYDATDGQHQFGNIYVYNDDEAGNLAGGNADAWLMPNDGGSNPSHVNNYGQDTIPFGTSGVNMILYHDERFRPFAIVHEFGHYAYDLLDEYIQENGLNPPDAVCIGPTGFDGNPAKACIMEAAWQRGDQINASGHVDEGTVSEFCSQRPPGVSGPGDYHTENNLQHQGNGQSCWETMVAVGIRNQAGDTILDLVPPTVPPGLPEYDTDRDAAAPINWIVLGQVQRFVLVVDRSGSMTGAKLDKTREGADHWAEAAIIGDRIGVVSYSDTVTVLPPPPPPPPAMYEIAGDTERGFVKDAIDISAKGLTAIGDGLRAGLTQIQDDAPVVTDRGQDVIVLVTDGHHNTGVEHPSDVLSDLIINGVQVYTIGIGSNINENLLNDIAHRTGGEFYPISSSDSQAAFQVESNLIKIERIAHGGDVVADVSGSTNPGVSEEDAYIERGSKMATFTLCWDNPRDLFSLELVSPNGDTITKDSLPANVRLVYSERSYMGFQVSNPAEGDWKLVVIPPERVDGVAHFHLFAFSQNPHIHGGIISPSQLCKPGITPPVRFQCYFDYPLTGLTVSGWVLLPDGEEIEMKFSDDGNKELGDLLPGDGLYSAIFPKIRKAGMYTIQVLVESDGESVSYGRIGEPPEDEDERPPIPPFRRQFTRTVGVGEVPFKDVKTEPNSGYPGERLQVTLKGQSTHFKRGSTSADFGEGIDAEEVEVLDKHTAQVLINVNEKAQLGLRDVTITTARYGETIEVEGGFQVVRYRCKCSVILARLRKLLRTIWQGLAFVDEIAPIKVNRGQNLRV